MDYDSMELTKINKNSKKKIIFMGTPEFSVPVLEGLIKEYGVRAIVTQPNRQKKNGELLNTPIKELGDKHLVLVLQPDNINNFVEEILNLEPDIIITCAYGQKLPKQLLDYPEFGCINVHASLLPKLRGGAPIHRAILKDFTKTGITIMKMAEGLDSGDIICQQEVVINEDDNATMLHDKLSKVAKELLLKTLPDIFAKNISPQVQEENLATYAFNITKEDEKIKFNNSVRKIYNQIRGLAMWPGAYCLFDDKRLKIFASRQSDNNFSNAVPGEITALYADGFGVKTGNREIIFTKVQPEGRSVMNANEYINGLQNQGKIVGKILR